MKNLRSMKKFFLIILEGFGLACVASLIYWVFRNALNGSSVQDPADLCSVAAAVFFLAIYFLKRMPRSSKGNFNLSIEQQKALQSILPAGIFTVDLKRNVTSWNIVAEEITGYRTQEVVGRPCTIFAKKPCEENCGLFDPKASKPLRNYECVIRRKDGAERYVLKRADLLYDAMGHVIGGIESFEDITERRESERRLKDSEERFRTIFENSAIGITVADNQERIISWNKYAEQILGMENTELYIRPVRSLYPVEE